MRELRRSGGHIFPGSRTDIPGGRTPHLGVVPPQAVVAIGQQQSGVGPEHDRRDRA
jgi:hypothetical protein